MTYSRYASHAGSWYDSSSTTLKAEVGEFIANAKDFQWSVDDKLLGIISPHAGISYSGTTAAHVYKALRSYIYGPKGSNIACVFLLGPSHHKGFEGVEVSAAQCYETPFGALPVDGKTSSDVIQALHDAKVPVKCMSKNTDEAEHSLEMQLPFLSHILHYPPNGAAPAKDRVQLVPLLIGWTTQEMEERIGAVLSSYFGSPQNIFVLSSDFCHWGSRFKYQFHYEKSTYPAIGDAIIAMDHEGMGLLEKKDIKGWYNYLSTTKNTICGRDAISVGMTAIKDKKAVAVRFLHYSQSSRCASLSDSSVSYAGAIITQM